MYKPVNAVIFEGGNPEGRTEKMLAEVRHAVLLDNINKLKNVPQIGATYLLTNFKDLAAEASCMGVTVWENQRSRDNFHFGKVLQELINSEGLENILYVGGASIPFVTIAELEVICEQLQKADKIVFSNNAQSADIIAFTPASLINSIDPPAMDNILAIELRDSAGVEMELFKNTLGLLFDLDTPADLLVLAGSPFTGPIASQRVKELKLDLSRLEGVKEVLRGDYEEIVLLGRVGAPVIAHINENIKARLRIFSEERGMKALGRVERGEVTSLMGNFLEEVGASKFIDYLEGIARCAFLDTRVLMEHFKMHLTAEERYLSDLGIWEELSNPLMKEFTRAAVQSKIPILCGGHSLVLGGLWALVEEIGPTY